MPHTDRARIEAALREAAARARVQAPLAADAALVEDLGLGSAEVLELVAELEDALDVTIPLGRLDRVRTVGDLVDVVAAVQAESAT